MNFQWYWRIVSQCIVTNMIFSIRIYNYDEFNRLRYLESSCSYDNVDLLQILNELDNTRNCVSSMKLWLPTKLTLSRKNNRVYSKTTHTQDLYIKISVKRIVSQTLNRALMPTWKILFIRKSHSCEDSNIADNTIHSNDNLCNIQFHFLDFIQTIKNSTSTNIEFWDDSYYCSRVFHVKWETGQNIRYLFE